MRVDVFIILNIINKKASDTMSYITCEHPRNEIIIKSDNRLAMDLILTVTTPKPYCKKCESYLPVNESPAKELVSFWFVRQDGIVKALAK